MNKILELSYRKAFRHTLILSLLFVLIPIFLPIKWPETLQSPISYTLPFVVFFSIFSRGIQLQKISFSFSFRFSPIWVYFLIFSMLSLAIVVESYLSNFIPRDGIFKEFYQQVNKIISELSEHKVSFFATSVLIAPLCEEIFFRGILLEGLLNKKIQPIKAILFSSFLFGLVHMNPWQLLGGFFLGSLIGLVYYTTRSVLNCILLHAFNNAISVWVILSGNLQQVEADLAQMNGVFPLLAFLMVCVLVYLLVLKRKAT